MSEEVSSRQRAVILEEETALLLAGERVPGSGSGSHKGDVESDCFLCECKFRGAAWNADQIGVELEWLETIATHARNIEKIPLLAVETEDADRAVLLPLDTYQVLAGVSAEEVRSAGVCHTRTLHLGAEEWAVLPFSVRLSQIEVLDRDWAVISWGEMRELRRQHQPERERQPLSRFAKHWRSPSLFPRHPFRR